MTTGPHQKKLLDGAVILVVDDELLIGLDTEWLLQEAGAVVSGPFTTLSSSLDALERDPPTLAVVDFRLGNNDTTLSLIERLTKRDIPTVLYSGQLSLSELPTNCTYLAKPASQQVLIQTAAALLGR